LNAHTSVLTRIATDQKKAVKIKEEVDLIMPRITHDDFLQLSDKILDIIPKEDGEDKEYLHRIENMALLGFLENISLSNSIFEVKRRKIIDLDKKGAFIPLATKRVFLKYYANDNTQHFSVWTATERNAYLKEITDCIQTYKPENIVNNEE